jgi:hypothetical protein
MVTGDVLPSTGKTAYHFSRTLFKRSSITHFTRLNHLIYALPD